MNPGLPLARTAGGPRRAGGYDDRVTVFHAVSLFDEVTVALADRDSVTVTGEGAASVPADGSNLATRAAEALTAAVPAQLDLDRQRRDARGIEPHDGIIKAALLDAGIAVEQNRQPAVARTFAAGRKILLAGDAHAALDRRLWPRDQGQLEFLLGCLSAAMSVEAWALGSPAAAGEGAAGEGAGAGWRPSDTW